GTRDGEEQLSLPYESSLIGIELRINRVGARVVVVDVVDAQVMGHGIQRGDELRVPDVQHDASASLAPQTVACGDDPRAKERAAEPCRPVDHRQPGRTHANGERGKLSLRRGLPRGHDSGADRRTPLSGWIQPEYAKVGRSPREYLVP